MATENPASRGTLLELEGSVFDDRFRIEDRIAEGGFAIVYRAWQIALERRVALKVLKPPKNQDRAARAEFREKFAIEAKTIARLRHPHIVNVYDFSVATLPTGEIAPWMALEWLEGETLATHLERRRQNGERGRQPAEALDFLHPVLEALAHAHEHGIAHRDIKPSNIMVTQTPNGTSLRVLDFGIAKIMLDEQTPNTGNTRTEGTPAFSPAYAAPEQVAFSRTGPWTDVHALGLMLTELMTDEPPFSDADPDAHLFEQVMARSRPTPASKGRSVGAFEPVLSKALSLSPRDRYRSAGELLLALDAAKANADTFVAGIADTAPATFVPDAVHSPGKRAARRRTLALMAAGILATAIAILGARGAFSTKEEAPPIAREPSATAASTPQAPPTSGPPREAAPSSVPAAAPSPSEAPSVARASLPPPPKAPKPRRNGKPTAPSAAPPAALSDGRDLFNDTK